MNVDFSKDFTKALDKLSGKITYIELTLGKKKFLDYIRKFPNN